MRAAARFVACLSLFLATPAGALSVSFTKIADAGMLGPGWVQSSVTFRQPALDDGLVAFSLLDGFSQGILTGSGGALTAVVDAGMLVPGSTTPFAWTSDVSLSNGHVAFMANDASYAAAIYTTLGGSLAPIATFGMPGVVAGSELQPGYQTPSIDGSNVAFFAVDPVLGHGYYTSVGGLLELSADQNTVVPGGDILLFDDPPILDGTAVVFRGQTATTEGIYVADGGVARVVADTDTPAPGGSGNFLDFSGIFAADDGDVVFEAFAADDQLFAEIDGNLVLISNEYVHAASISDGVVAWHASSDTVGQPDSYSGLYVLWNGQREKVIEASDVLDGRVVSFFELGPEGLDGNQLAFTAWFEDGTSGVFVANIPEPGSALMLGAGLAMLTAARRRLQRPAPPPRSAPLPGAVRA